MEASGEDLAQGMKTHPLAGNFEAELYFLGGRVREDMTNPVGGEPPELGIS